MDLKVNKVTVTEVLHGDTFKVTPHWKSKDNMDGDTITINGFATPEQGLPGYQEAKKKLSDTILGKEIELTNPIKTTKGKLICDVAMKGKNLTTYFTK